MFSLLPAKLRGTELSFYGKALCAITTLRSRPCPWAQRPLLSVGTLLRLDDKSAVVFRFALSSSNRRYRSTEFRVATRPTVQGLHNAADPPNCATTLLSISKYSFRNPNISLQYTYFTHWQPFSNPAVSKTYNFFSHLRSICHIAL